MSEKNIENAIKEYLELMWAVVEWMQGWKILIKKWKYEHMMKLQKEWCPDIICLYKWIFIWIEVKKNEEEIEHWLKQEQRYLNGEKIPKSYEREENQIKYKQKILKNWWHFILTCKTQEIINRISKTK